MYSTAPPLINPHLPLPMLPPSLMTMSTASRQLEKHPHKLCLLPSLLDYSNHLLQTARSNNAHCVIVKTIRKDKNKERQPSKLHHSAASLPLLSSPEECQPGCLHLPVSHSLIHECHQPGRDASAELPTPQPHAHAHGSLLSLISRGLSVAHK